MKSLYASYGAAVKARLIEAVRTCIESPVWYWYDAREKRDMVHYVFNLLDTF